MRSNQESAPPMLAGRFLRFAGSPHRSCLPGRGQGPADESAEVLGKGRGALAQLRQVAEALGTAHGGGEQGPRAVVPRQGGVHLACGLILESIKNKTIVLLLMDSYETHRRAKRGGSDENILF